MREYTFVTWRLDYGEFGPARGPALAVGFGGDRSSGPLVVYDSVQPRAGSQPLWAWSASWFSRVRFVDVDPRCAGPELLASSYGGIGDSGGVGLSYSCRDRPPLRLWGDRSKDFDVADVDGDGQLELALAVRNAMPKIDKGRPGQRASAEPTYAEPGVRMAALALDPSGEPRWRSLGFVQATELDPRADVEILNTRFFDVDGDGELELVYHATRNSLAVIEWRETLAQLAYSDVDLICGQQRASPIWCDPVDAVGVGLEFAVIGDSTWVVSAHTCHETHGGGDCHGFLRVHQFARGRSGVRLQRRVDVECRTGEACEIPPIPTSLELVAGADGAPLAIVGYSGYSESGEISGGLRAYDFARETWTELVAGEHPELPVDIEAVPGSGVGHRDGVDASGRRVTLPGPGPHRIVEVRGAGGPIPACQSPVERDCWVAEPRSDSVLLRSDAAPGEWRVEFEQRRTPTLAVADAIPRIGSGLWFLIPSNTN